MDDRINKFNLNDRRGKMVLPLSVALALRHLMRQILIPTLRFDQIEFGLSQFDFQSSKVANCFSEMSN